MDLAQLGGNSTKNTCKECFVSNRRESLHANYQSKQLKHRLSLTLTYSKFAEVQNKTC